MLRLSPPLLSTLGPTGFLLFVIDFHPVNMTMHSMLDGALRFWENRTISALIFKLNTISIGELLQLSNNVIQLQSSIREHGVFCRFRYEYED